ncbi:MAG: hypothetical protein ACE5OR_04300 [bacterium]
MANGGTDMKYVVSACLAGVNCRYDGTDNLIPEVAELVPLIRAS